MKIIDTDVINKRLHELETAVSYLESKKKISEKELLKNLEIKFALEDKEV